jgi:murein DD-endopeptidase MepM/ murein hydrolase activator NlpD
MPVFPTIATAVITQRFGNHNPSMYAGDGEHKGLDLGVPTNTPIYSCLDGMVEVAINLSTGYGRHVRIRHGDGSVAIYGHLNKILVVEKQTVGAGQPIGLSGGDPHDGVSGDGYSTGAHLHWEIRPAGVTTDQGAVDPHEYCLQYVTRKWTTGKCISDIGLNVRATPATSAPILYTLQKNQVVKVVHRTGDWAQLLSLRSEWCWMAYLQIEDGAVDPVEPVEELTIEEKVERLWKAHTELHP